MSSKEDSIKEEDGKEKEEEDDGSADDPVMVIGGGIAGVSFVETLATLCPHVRVELVSASALVRVARNLTQTGIALEHFDVTEEPKAYLESLHRNVIVTHDSVAALNAEKHQILLGQGGWKRYSQLCICTGGRPYLIPGSNEFVIGIRDTETVQELQGRLREARRVMVIGNGGIATEFVYEVANCEVVWAIKDKYFGNSFFDGVAAKFFTPKLTKPKGDDSNSKQPSKRMKYVIDDNTARHPHSGSALGPDWISSLNLSGTTGNKKVYLESEVQVKAIFKKNDLPHELEPLIVNETLHATVPWPVFVQLTNDKIYGCDFIVSATGVTPNSEIFSKSNNLALAEDGGIKVNNRMQTTEKDVYAAGDVCHADWPIAEHWLQMRLWTQARQMGAYAAYSIGSIFDSKIDPLFHFNFEVFTHVTKFFGYKVILLGLFNGQKLSDKYEALFRVTEEDEYVKVLLKDGKMKGAVLIGETDLEETFENLIHNQIDLSHYGDDLLNPSVDIEDYFD
ncbi:Pyridine nucleotide-disulfide oxidoreductase domain-containing protein 1 [Halotydeus destructor]|nr:Pyridine nucleotide-disulfide oxidoreductase domain-containing protein 1 [Halotydeus destructor]